MSPSFQGLDRAVAPPAATARKMLDTIDGRWWCVYIGGPYYAAHGWSPEILREYLRHGIDRFMLTYVGQQAGGQFKEGDLTAQRGRKDAHDALAIARSYGYSGNFPLCLDIEQSTFNHSQAKTVAYAKAWCATVRDAGARPGIYANPAPLLAMAKSKVPAEFIWIASWVSTTASHRDPHKLKGIPAELWGHAGQRAWQYGGIINGRPCQVLGLDVDINVADLGCLAPAPNGTAERAPKRVRALRRGDRGPLVVRATHRLSILRSPETGRPYLDGPRSRFDAETEAALKAFQSQHRLLPTGRYGRDTARALLTAVKKLKRTHDGAKHELAATNLPGIVREFRRLDAQADRAWQRLELYGRRRGHILERAKDRADGDSDMDRIAASLAGIERQLATLVQLERQEVDLERQEVDLERRALEFARAGGGTTMTQTAEGEVEPARYVANPGARYGSNGAGATVERPRRLLKDLSDEELDRRIGLLDRRLEESRKLRIARYARAEKELAELTAMRVVDPVVEPGRKPDKRRPGRKPVERPPKHAGVTALQRALNRFTEKYLDGLVPLDVDGKKGTETDKRIRTAKYYLGYRGAERRSAAVTGPFLNRVQHPRSLRFSSPQMLARAARRRRKQRNAAKRIAAGAIEGTPKHIIDTIVLPIAQRCEINRTPTQNDAANAVHGLTNTGNRSDHQGPPDVAWAADMSNGGSPTPEMDKLARSLAHRFDIPWSGAGLVSATHGGYRYQLIYRTMEGGNHYNHVHFGVKDV